MEVKATFTYLNKTIQVLCKDDEDINKMYEKFAAKLSDGSEASHYIYYYNGYKLGHLSTIGKNKYLVGKRDINITVQKKLRIVKCPKCICNDCIVNLNDYIVSYYGCKYNHEFTSVYDKYITDQNLDNTELRCNVPDCPHDQQNYTIGFYKCLDCSKLVKRSKYYCRDHLREHENHNVVKFDKKNYFCVTHFKPYTKYCFDHKENLCDDCVDEHSEDKVKPLELMTPNLDELKKSLKIMEENIRNLKFIIEDIQNGLNGALRVFNRYFYIANDIIGKYELFNKDLKNYRILKSLRNLKFSNERMNKDLKKIIDEEDDLKKINSIIKIHLDKTENYKKNNLGEKSYLSRDNDDDWLEEIIKIENNKIHGQFRKNTKTPRPKK